ncbi:helix-turn-helix domain-containing protein [Streptomyces sp. NPDC006641]|uniref:helix-turn-helix domain-containing protein n=1 Tax=unclassified Streptomyces TaxID=2593676 RepID=UPI0036C0F6C5
MTASTPPTLRQRRLGAELRKLREQAGLSSTEAAARIGIQQARMSMIEAGRYGVSADRVRAMAHSYACADGALIEALGAMTGRRGRNWWDEYRELLPMALVEVAELEHEATMLRVAVLISMPGLLQTAQQARASYSQSVPPLRPYEVEHRAAFRIRRQGILHRDPSVPYTAIIHEAVLRMGVGGPDVMRAQLQHLIDMSEQADVTILVIPFERADFPVSGQPITYASGPVPQLDTVLLDSDHGCDLLYAQAQLARYRAVLDRMERCALGQSRSRDFIRKIAKSL